MMRIANSNRIPVTPRGGGTNLSGGSIPIHGGILLCTSRMNRINRIDTERLSAMVEPGVVLNDLLTRLAEYRLFFPPDPQSYLTATLGGMIAENAGGPACLKYGVTKQYVRGLEIVLPTGDIVHLGTGTLCASAGYDMLHLFIGCEGTLGVITKAELRLITLPRASRTIMAVYDDAAAAGETVSKVLECGVIPAKIELIDNWIINRIEDVMPIGLPKNADAILLFEADGIEEAVQQETQQIAEVARKCRARLVRVAKDQDEANKYWAARKAGFAAAYGSARTVFSEDVTVPRNKIPAFIKACKKLSKKYDTEIVIFGHAGDGNLHPSILTDTGDRDHYARSIKAVEEMIEAALELGGVLSGEHGIGLEKQQFFDNVTNPVVIDMMKGIKGILDPNNIMNPGKIWGN